MKSQPKTHDRSSIIETYARSRSLRAAAKELQLPLALVIDTVREAGVMRRPGAVRGKPRPELKGKREPSTHRGTASPQEIVMHYLQGYSIEATGIMLDIPQWRVREAVHAAGVQRAPSGKGGLVFSRKHVDFVTRDFVWDLDDIVARRAKGETWKHIRKELGITWHVVSLIRHVTTERPSVKTRTMTRTHDRSSIIETYARSRSLRAAAKELQLPLALVIDTVREAGVMRRPGSVSLGKQRLDLQGKREQSAHQGTASPQEIVAHYLQGYGTHGTSIMLDVPEWRVREAVLDAGVQRAPSGKGELVFSLKRVDFVTSDFVWDLDDIVARRAKGETWEHIHKELDVTWHIESLIRHVTTARPSVKTRTQLDHDKDP